MGSVNSGTLQFVHRGQSLIVVLRSQAKGTLDDNGWRPWNEDKLGPGLVWGFRPAGLARGGESLLV